MSFSFSAFLHSLLPRLRPNRCVEPRRGRLRQGPNRRAVDRRRAFRHHDVRQRPTLQRDGCWEKSSSSSAPNSAALKAALAALGMRLTVCSALPNDPAGWNSTPYSERAPSRLAYPLNAIFEPVKSLVCNTAVAGSVPLGGGPESASFGTARGCPWRLPLSPRCRRLSRRRAFAAAYDVASARDPAMAKLWRTYFPSRNSMSTT